jgi:GNAT superfamily N-acetyltransferase
MTSEDQPTKYQFLSIDEECEKWATSCQDDTDGAPPCFAILSQFYDELMISTFPLEEERDDLEDWFQCFHFQIKQVRWRQQGRENKEMQGLTDEEILLLRGNAMDVVIMIADNAGDKVSPSAPTRQLDHQASSFAGLYAPNASNSSTCGSSKPTIIGAAAVEYYKESRVGLLSYIVLHPDFRGQGLAAPLHKEALSRLTRLSSLYSTTKDCKPLMQAVFAETNTAAAGDVSPEQSLLRHKSLNKLGYRLVNFPYAQPPLSTKDVDASFDDLLLLVYFPGRGEVTEDHAHKYCPWYQNHSSDTESVQLDVNIPFHYVEDFYKSVFGYNSVEEQSLSNRDDVDGIPDYRDAKYYKLAEWFCKHKCNSGLVDVELCSPPWKDCKEALYLEMADWNQSNEGH